MACLEHQCLNCGWLDWNNIKLTFCPKCGSERITNAWDEEGDEH